MTAYFFKCENETYKVSRQAEKQIKAKKNKSKTSQRIKLPILLQILASHQFREQLSYVCHNYGYRNCHLMSTPTHLLEELGC